MKDENMLSLFTANSSATAPKAPEAVASKSSFCAVCKKEEYGKSKYNTLLNCFVCNTSYHQFCHFVPIFVTPKSVGRGQTIAPWTCLICEYKKATSKQLVYTDEPMQREQVEFELSTIKPQFIQKSLVAVHTSLRSSLAQIRIQEHGILSHLQNISRKKLITPESTIPQELIQSYEKLSMNKLRCREVLATLKDYIGFKRPGEPKIEDAAEVAYESAVCCVCFSGEDHEDNDVLLCDGKGCFRSMHMKCVLPHITQKDLDNDPANTWFCCYCTTYSKLVYYTQVHHNGDEDEIKEDEEWEEYWDVFVEADKEAALAKKMRDCVSQGIGLKGVWKELMEDDKSGGNLEEDDEESAEDDDFSGDKVDCGESYMSSVNLDDIGSVEELSDGEEYGLLEDAGKKLQDDCGKLDVLNIVHGKRNRTTVDYNKLNDCLFGELDSKLIDDEDDYISGKGNNTARNDNSQGNEQSANAPKKRRKRRTKEEMLLAAQNGEVRPKKRVGRPPKEESDKPKRPRGRPRKKPIATDDLASAANTSMNTQVTSLNVATTAAIQISEMKTPESILNKFPTPVSVPTIMTQTTEKIPIGKQTLTQKILTQRSQESPAAKPTAVTKRPRGRPRKNPISQGNKRPSPNIVPTPVNYPFVSLQGKQNNFHKQNVPLPGSTNIMSSRAMNGSSSVTTKSPEENIDSSTMNAKLSGKNGNLPTLHRNLSAATGNSSFVDGNKVLIKGNSSGNMSTVNKNMASFNGNISAVSNAPAVNGNMQSFSSSVMNVPNYGINVSALNGNNNGFNASVPNGNAYEISTSAVSGNSYGFNGSALNGNMYSFSSSPLNQNTHGLDASAININSHSLKVSALKTNPHSLDSFAANGNAKSYELGTQGGNINIYGLTSSTENTDTHRIDASVMNGLTGLTRLAYNGQSYGSVQPGVIQSKLVPEMKQTDKKSS